MSISVFDTSATEFAAEVLSISVVPSGEVAPAEIKRTQARTVKVSAVFMMRITFADDADHDDQSCLLYCSLL